MSCALRVSGAVLLTFVAAVCAAQSGRQPVLPQVDVPHSYYWRELYLPQLTTGPSSVAFLPDGQTVIYSMGGSLWRQHIDAGEAEELTHARSAYDYQPDVDRAGQRVVFSRYDGRSIELWLLDLTTGREWPLTENGAVNVEARFAPDDRRLAWVSTARDRRFDLHFGSIDDRGRLTGAPLFEARRSAIDRYYYSPWDHAINPSWSPDGRELLYVGNPEVAWGSGDLWAVVVDQPTQRTRLLSEETSWSARPELSPDGRRLLYSSYHGRQWHQLWLTTRAGAAPLPLTFGDFDRRNARWSPDGKRVAYISNETGNTSLVVQAVVGGTARQIRATSRRYQLSQGTLALDIRDAAGQRVSARVSVLGSDGRAYAPQDAWLHADDGFDRALQQTETHYFHCAPPCELSVPAGEVRIDVRRGLRHRSWSRAVTIAAGATAALDVRLARHDLPESFGRWLSADLHVHMNYGGHYRNTPAQLAAQARAEDLDVVYNLIVNKEQRVPDVAHFRGDVDPAGGDDVLLMHAQEFHTSFWGHTGLLHLSSHLLLPDFSSYRHTGLASPYPDNRLIADLARAQGGLIGYVHPFDWEIDPPQEPALSSAFPADAAHGKVDYVEVVGFSDHKATAAIWYRLLNLGFRIPAGAGTDAMANYASLRGPVGMNRVFLETDGERTPQAARAALAAGRTFATNGPLLGLELEGHRAGDTLERDAAGPVGYRIAMRSPVPVDHLELVANGRVVKSFDLEGERTAIDDTGTVDVDASGWLLLRAWNDGADPGVFDLYPYATTSPIYLALPAPAPPAPEDARYFVGWLDRVIEAATGRDDYNTAEERRAVLEYLRIARGEYASLIGAAEGAAR